MYSIPTDTTHTRPRTVLVWDPLVRIFHWSLATFFLVAYLTEDELQTAHTYVGYAIAMLVVFRLFWGFFGTRHARFRDFMTGPGELKCYVNQMISRRAPRHLGHNPAGAAMIIALLLSLALTTLLSVTVTLKVMPGAPA